MKNHFYISYAGNKRMEVERLYNVIINDIDDITHIIEPYAGTCAFSYYIYLKHPDKIFILNDIDNHLKLMFELFKSDKKIKQFEEEYNKIAIDLDKEKYNKIVKQDSLLTWFIARKIYNIRPGLFPVNYKYKPLKLSDFPIYNFFRNANIIFHTDDAINIYEQYKDNKHAFIFMDPPYLAQYNDFYTDKRNINIYEYMCNNPMENEKAKICFILENMWIIKLLFKNSKGITYEKKYQSHEKRKTEHILLINY